MSRTYEASLESSWSRSFDFQQIFGIDADQKRTVRSAQIPEISDIVQTEKRAIQKVRLTCFSRILFGRIRFAAKRAVGLDSGCLTCRLLWRI